MKADKVYIHGKASKQSICLNDPLFAVSDHVSFTKDERCLRIVSEHFQPVILPPVMYVDEYYIPGRLHKRLTQRK